MFKSLLLAACLLLAASPALPLHAQETFVIVPDNPGGGGGAGNAVTTSSLNVRSGPGTRYVVIDVLRSGESLRVSNCNNGWCWATHRGPSGWVSQNHVTRVGGGGGGGSAREACFYDEPRFRGRSFCARPGDSDRDLGSWNNRIASISIRGLPTVQICTDRNFNDCDAFNRDVASLPWWLERNVSSYRVLH